MIVQTKEQILRDYGIQELLLIEKLVNKRFHGEMELQEAYKLIKDLSTCRQTISKLSNVFEFSQVELKYNRDTKTLDFKPNKCVDLTDKLWKD